MNTARAGLRVLVVDDDVDQANSLCALIEMHGASATATYGAETAKKVAELYRPDVLIADMHMLGADACGLLAHLRQVSRPLTPALFVAISGDHSAEEKCLKAGFDLFFRKPFEPQMIDTVLYTASTLGPIRKSGESAATRQ